MTLRRMTLSSVTLSSVTLSSELPVRRLARSFGADCEALEVLVQRPDLESSEAAKLYAEAIRLHPSDRAGYRGVLLHGRDPEANIDEGAVRHLRLGNKVHAAQRDVRSHRFKLFFVQECDGQVTFESFMNAAAGHQKLLAPTSERKEEVHVGER
jgi:hypothetical protein